MNFLCFVVFQTHVLAGNIRPGSCPELPLQPNFEIDRYMGQWHNYLTNDGKNIPEDKECTTATYGLLNDRQISVNNTSKDNHNKKICIKI